MSNSDYSMYGIALFKVRNSRKKKKSFDRQIAFVDNNLPTARLQHTARSPILISFELGNIGLKADIFVLLFYEPN